MLYIVYTHYCTHYTVRTHAGVHCIFMFCIVPLKTEPAMDSWSGCYGIYLAFVYACIFGPQNQTYAVASALTVTSSAFMRSYRLFWDSVYIYSYEELQIILGQCVYSTRMWDTSIVTVWESIVWIPS